MAEEHYVTKTGMTVDPSRFKDTGESLVFRPFEVRHTRALADSLAREEISPELELLVAVRDEGPVVALSRQQMAYHHVAQGTEDGKAWLVFF